MPFDERRQLIHVMEGATEGMHAGWSQALEEERAREEALRDQAAIEAAQAPQNIPKPRNGRRAKEAPEDEG
jgi:hypothetical protein